VAEEEKASLQETIDDHDGTMKDLEHKIFMYIKMYLYSRIYICLNMCNHRWKKRRRPAYKKLLMVMMEQ
jgi:hypothetical protein